MLENEKKKKRILVTGEHDNWNTEFAQENPTSDFTFVSLPVLEYKKLPIPDGVFQKIREKKIDWIFFTSSRSILFFNESLIEENLTLPLEIQIACVGEKTKKVAEKQGWQVDFYPTEPGSEAFIQEFLSLLKNYSTPLPRILIPMAERGRTMIPNLFFEMGCVVTAFSLYESKEREKISLLSQELTRGDFDALLVTSPKSFDALLKKINLLPKTIPIIAMGKYTYDTLQQKGVEVMGILPESSFQKIGEVFKKR